MKVLIGSYDKNIYEVTVNEKKAKLINSNIVSEDEKPSYITGYRDSTAYIFMDGDTQYLKIGEKKVSLGSDTSCHVSYDDVNNLFYTSHYHTGVLSVINYGVNKWTLKDKYEYTDDSKIHFAKWIDSIELTGVCDLGDDKLHLYEVNNAKLKLQSTFQFPKGSGPRHFIEHKRLPIIYVVTEHSSEIYVLEYKNNKLNLLHKVYLEKGDAAAIRTNSSQRFLYASDRLDNSISCYEILDDGFLIPTQVISTYGDHPRDFNISNDDKWVVAANMNSNTLTLYSRDLQSGSLILVDKDFEIPRPATVYFK